MKYYLAYGSNLNKEQMQMRCPGAVPIGTMLLKGFELQFKGPLTIKKKNGGRVPIGVWQVNEEHERSLDRYYDICAKGYEDFGFDVKYLNEALKRSMEEFE